MDELAKIDKMVFECHCCEDYVEKFPNSKTVHLGETNDIVLIGEAPANNGWRKSHMVWRDEKGKMLPSGVVLQRLFAIMGRDVLKTTFLEAIKCYPIERKNIKICAKNCKHILMRQLSILKPKVVITLGEAPTRMLLDEKFNKFGEVVGNIYEADGYKIIPIYHPSPISPMSYKGNVAIMEKIKQII